MGPKWVKMRVGREGRKWRPKTEKLRSENTKIGLENHKKMGSKIKKMGRGDRVGRGREGKMGRKKINK
jgi:hypothetical protein